MPTETLEDKEKRLAELNTRIAEAEARLDDLEQSEVQERRYAERYKRVADLKAAVAVLNTKLAEEHAADAHEALVDLEKRLRKSATGGYDAQ